MSVLIMTSLGDIVIDLHSEKCPLTCKNFLKLCKIKYYNGCLFHTVQKDFTAQTGDPTGTGLGGDSIYKFLYGEQARFFGDEIHLDLKHSKTGTVAMASGGENLNASQFYFTLRDDLDYLDGKHTVFGEIAEGLDTLARINEAYVDAKNRPFKNIRIMHTHILEDPFVDPPQLADMIPDASPKGKPKEEVELDVQLAERPKKEKREHSHDKEKIRRRSPPHGYGDGKRQDRDEREDKADIKYNGRRQHREDVRERERRYDDGVIREKKEREDEDRRRRRRDR